MIGKLVLGTTKDSSIPVILKETGPELYVEKTINNQGNIVNAGTSIINTSNATGLGSYVLCYAYYNNTNISGAVDFHTIERVSAYSLQETFDSTNITSVDLSSLSSISGNYACDNTFRNCQYLISVDLSSLITISGNYASRSMFYGCLRLNSIDLHSLSTISNDYSAGWMFQGCSSLQTMNLSSLTTISGQYVCQYMFQNCTSLVSVDLSSLETMSGQYACQYMFQNCSGLTSVDLSSLETISGQYACQYMFQSCSTLTTVDLSALESINPTGSISSSRVCYYMFQNCTNLVSVDLSSLTTLRGSEAFSLMFSGCSNLESVDLSGITQVSGSGMFNSMFQNCAKLENVDLSSLCFFGDLNDTTGNSDHCNYMFSGCTSLKHVDLSNLEHLVNKYKQSGSTSYYWGTPASYMFYYSGIESNPLTNVSCLWGMPYGFSSCTSLLDGTFPKVVYICGNGTTPMQYCFAGCTNMTKCDFPALKRVSQTNLFSNMFQNCTNLTDVHFPMFTWWGSGNPFSSTTFKTGNTPTITVHFRKNIQSAIESLTDYATLWGAASIVFDQIGTITVNNNTYYRMGYCNKPGYVAWIKSDSHIEIDGTTYNFSLNRLSYITNYDNINKRAPGAAFCFTDENTVDVYATTPDVHVGDYVYSDNRNVTTPDLEITASTVEIIYTADSTEPDVGDTAYSDVSGTVLGTISAVA